MKSSLAKIRDQNVFDFFSMLIKVFVLVLIILMVCTIYAGLNDDKYVLEPLQVPKGLEEAGYTGTVIANHIQDKITDLKNSAQSSKSDSTQFEVNSNNDLNVQVMGLGVSSNSLVHQLRSLLGKRSNVISGELIDIDNQLQLTLRLTGKPSEKIIEPYELGSKGEALENIINSASESVLYYTDPYRLAVMQYRRGDQEEALKIIRYIIDERPNERKWGYLAWANLYQSNNDLERAERMLDKALELDPNFSLANTNMGWLAFRNEDYVGAIEHLSKNQASEDQKIGVYNGLALSHLRLGETEKAEAYYKKNVEVNSSEFWVYTNYSSFLINTKKDTAASLALLKLAEKNVERNADFYMVRAGSYAMKNKIDSALVFIDLALEYNPEHVPSLLYGGNILHGMKKDYVSAEKYLAKYVVAAAKQGYERGMIQNGYNTLAMNDYRLNQFDSALVHVDKAIELYSDNPYPWTTKAETYAFMNNHRKFYQYLDSALVRGFELQNYIEEEPYIRYKDEPRMISILNRKEEALKN